MIWCHDYSVWTSNLFKWEPRASNDTNQKFASVPLLTILSPWCWGYLIVYVWRFWYCEFSILVVINSGVSHDSSGLVCIASTEMSLLCLVWHPVQTDE